MKYIIKTSDKGKKIDVRLIDNKREEIKNIIIRSNKEYLEYEAIIGMKNYKGELIEEICYIIEETEEYNLVSIKEQ